MLNNLHECHHVFGCVATYLGCVSYLGFLENFQAHVSITPHLYHTHRIMHLGYLYAI